MDKYSFKDLIINPEIPGLENLIGKEVYFNDVPIYCIRMANKNYEVGILKSVRKEYSAPFFVETPSGCMLNYACIIPRKVEPKPEYVPFKSMEEFVERYTEVRKKAEVGSLNYNLFQCGMWLKEKRTDSDILCMVTEIWENGVVVGNNKISNEENAILSDFTFWSNLYLGYTFLDGSPCGIKVEDSNE